MRNTKDMKKNKRISQAEENKESLLKIIFNEELFVMTKRDMTDLLHKSLRQRHVPDYWTFSRFEHFLVERTGFYKRINIKKPNNVDSQVYLFTQVTVSPYEIALAILYKSHLSHYSALYINDLTVNIPKNIYVNKELAKLNWENDDTKNAQLTQEKIDYAFSKKMRKTNQIATFKFDNKSFKVYMLNSKPVNKKGIIRVKPFGFSGHIEVTDVARTLLDSVVRPSYSGGVEEVLNVFKEALERSDYSVDEMINALKYMDYIYPYEQAVFFYMKKAGAHKSDLQKIKKWGINRQSWIFNFYLDYQLIKKQFDEESKIYYPGIIK